MGKLGNPIWLSTRPGGMSEAISPTVPWDPEAPAWAAAVLQMRGLGRLDVDVQGSYDGCTWCLVGKHSQVAVGWGELLAPPTQYAYGRSRVKLYGYDVDGLVDWGRLDRAR